MKIVVCCKAVPKGAANIKLDDRAKRVTYEDGSLQMNESDACALEEGLELKKRLGGEVTVVTAGGLTSQEMLRVALAKGADKVVRIDADDLDSDITARLIAQAIKGMEYDLVICGVESWDDMSARVGMTVAELLGIPHAFAVTKVEIGSEQEIVKVHREMGQGTAEVMEIHVPALLAVESGIRLISYPLLMKLMQARRLPIRTIGADELTFSDYERPEDTNELVEVFEPSRSNKCEMFKGNPEAIASEVVRKINNALQ